MCEPISVGTALAGASALASVGGGIMNSNAAASNQANAVRAKNEAAARTLAQQEDLQKQSSAIFDTNLNTYQAPERTLQTAQAADTNAVSQNRPDAAALSGGATTGNAPRVVQDSANASIASRIAKLRASDAALGNLSGYSSAAQNLARGTKDAALKIGTIGTFANDNATTGAARMQADVANSQQVPGPWGDLLQGAGSIGSYYAGKNGAFDNILGPKNTGSVTGKVQYY